MSLVEMTKLEHMRYFTPPAGFILKGRDGMVNITWDGKPPIPLPDEEWISANEAGHVDYDTAGNGIYQALRLNPDCVCAKEYAGILRDAYPHIISEIGGNIIMLDAKEIDTPYLDRKINGLKIMALLEPDNPLLQLEIARAFSDRGSRLSTLNKSVESWYAAEKHFARSLELDPQNSHAGYEHGEALYILGRYLQASEKWSNLLPSLDDEGKIKVSSRISAILAGKVPLVPPLDYLTAISVALEEHHAGRNDEAVAIIEDVLADQVFAEQFPLNEIYYLLGKCYEEVGMPDKAEEAFKRS